MPRPLHIGIVACSAEGASLCYRTLCAEGPELLGAHAHPEVSLHSASLADYVACLDGRDMEGVARLMLASATKLAAAGADFLVCPDNTIHQAFPLVEPVSPLPWLHIAEVVVAERLRAAIVDWASPVRNGCSPARSTRKRSLPAGSISSCRVTRNETRWGA